VAERRPGRRSIAGCLVLVLAALLAACGSGPGSGGYAVRTVQYPWSAAKLTNAILARVVATHPGLGVSGLTLIQVGPATGWAGAQRGDVDLITEVAMPNQSALAAKAKAQVQLVHQTYGGAQQGWFVPTYALAPGQPLAGLHSITQLNQYAGPLGDRLVDSDPSFITTQQNAKRLAAYHITLRQVTSSEAAQLAELRRVYQRHQPIVLYLYHPHWVFQQFAMTQLAEPNPPGGPDCFTTGSGACALQPYAAWTAASTRLRQRAPRFYDLLRHFELPITDIEPMLKSVDVDKQPVEEVAARWVDAHPDQVAGWMRS
jgi:glycine betaine/proline transport system substrate-binding protein